MQKISDFVAYLNKQLENHACYLWGGQCENVLSKTFNQILKAETSQNNGARVIAHVGNMLKYHDMSSAQFFDCSGLGTYYFVANGLIKSDCTANDLYKKCTKLDIKKDALRAGDMVFKVDATGKAVHVGYMINSKECVEMYGRDYGILKAKIGAGSDFNKAGRPKFEWE